MVYAKFAEFSRCEVNSAAVHEGDCSVHGVLQSMGWQSQN